MKRNLLTMLLVGLCALTASAHDFEDRRVYYNITSETDLTVEVTFKGDYSNSYSHEYSNRVAIPSEVTYNGETYRVTSIGTYAFSGCSNITSITLPESVTSIGSFAFEGCSSITAITLPESVTSIGGSAFAGCSSLTAITIPEGVTSIGNYTFSRCSSLTSITIPESVTSIGYMAFQYCSNLTAITIPEGVTSIDRFTFYDCESLTAINIPSSVTNIGWSAFFGCSSLASITCLALEPPYVGSDAFSGVGKDIPVYVLASSLQDYLMANDWGYFNNFLALPEYRITYMVDGELVKSESLLPGTPINHPETPTKQGYIFSGWRWSQKVFNFTENDNVLYTNAKCTNTSYGDQFVGWHVLYDGNANTFFHSEYSNVDSEDGQDHYLRVDMGQSAKEFSFTYTVRGTIPNNGNYSPKTMVVEGSNTADGEYTEIATLTNLPSSAAAVYESGILGNGNAYRYIRFRVTETFTNYKVQGHPYFFMAEFGMTKYHEGKEAQYIPSTMPAEDIVISGWFVRNNGITSLDQLNNETLYSISLPHHSKCPASWAVAENGTAMKSNADLMLPIDANDTKQQFAFISNDGGTTRYLYHAAEKKFVGKKGVLTAEPVDAILLMDGAYENTFFAYFDNDNYINVGGFQEIAINSWNTANGGNSAIIAPVGNFDPTEALSKFGGTGIEKSTIRTEKSEIIYDLQGRRVEKATKGIYIVNGKKVVIK